MGNKYYYGSGQFLNMNTHKVEEISEHATDVKTHPEKYGLKKDDVEGLDITKDRTELVSKAMDNGWIRVRSDRRGVWISFQYRAPNNKKALEAILSFIDEHKITDDTKIRIGNLQTEKTKEVTAKEFRKRDSNGKFFDDDNDPDIEKKIGQDLAKLHTTPDSKLTPAERKLKKARGKGFGSDKERPSGLTPFQMNMLLRTSEQSEEKRFRPLFERVDPKVIMRETEESHE